MSLPYRRKPCSNCPFRKDCLKGWLGKERMKEIVEAKSFVCHKNNDLQCSGHMILNGTKNNFVYFARVFGQPLSLSGKELVFESAEECINHHNN